MTRPTGPEYSDSAPAEAEALNEAVAAKPKQFNWKRILFRLFVVDTTATILWTLAQMFIFNSVADAAHYHGGSRVAGMIGLAFVTLLISAAEVFAVNFILAVAAAIIIAIFAFIPRTKKPRVTTAPTADSIVDGDVVPADQIARPTTDRPAAPTDDPGFGHHGYSGPGTGRIGGPGRY